MAQILSEPGGQAFLPTTRALRVFPIKLVGVAPDAPSALGTPAAGLLSTAGRKLRGHRLSAPEAGQLFQ